MIELYQAEWCPYSHRVRRRLTELGLDFVAHQVPVDRARRAALVEATGSRSIPTLVDGGRVFADVDEILAHLDAAYREADDVEERRLKDAEEGPGWRAAGRAGAGDVERIVLAVDGGRSSRRAAVRAALVATAARAPVVVAGAGAALAEALAVLAEHGVEAKPLERPGEPSTVGAQVAHEVAADLLVLAGDGAAPVGGACDVLVVR